MLPPQHIAFNSLLSTSEWPRTLRLCNQWQEPSLWATLAAAALQMHQFDYAEIALAQLGLPDKLYEVQHLKSLPSAEARQAELLCLRGQHDGAEAVLLQAGLIWRALSLNIDLNRWTRALDLASQGAMAKVWPEVVLYYRQQHLLLLGQQETDPKFIQLSQLEQFAQIDPNAVQSKINAELEREKSRAAPYKGILAANLTAPLSSSTLSASSASISIPRAANFGSAADVDVML